MSATLLPGIGELDPGSLCYSIYSQLYHNFFNAQDKKDEAHPYGISEGDETSIRLRNTAYNFAEAISGAVAGDGSGSGTVGILTGYLKKSGGDMTGMLRAGYGFEAGIGNVPVLNLYCENIPDTDGSLDKPHEIDPLRPLQRYPLRRGKLTPVRQWKLTPLAEGN